MNEERGRKRQKERRGRERHTDKIEKKGNVEKKR